MRLRSRRQSLPVWTSTVSSSAAHGPPPASQPARAARIRWWIRTGVLLSAIGLIQFSRAVRTRWWPVLTGCVLTAVGIMLRGTGVGVVLLPGLMLLLSAPLIPASTKADRIRRSRLERELAAYFTPAHRHDLETTLDRYPDGITCELRDILARQAAATVKGIPGGRGY